MIRKTRQTIALNWRAEVGVGPRADRRGDLLHLLRSLVGPDHLPDEHARVDQARDRHEQHDPERDLFNRIVIRVAQEAEEVKGLGRRRFAAGWCRGLGQSRRGGRGHRG